MQTEVLKKSHPKSLLISSEQFSTALSFNGYLIRFLQHLFKQIVSGFGVKEKLATKIRQIK